MTAVLDKATEADLEAYQMPQPAIGQAVLWYEHADPNGTPHIAYVRDRNKRGCLLMVNGVSMPTVRHITDPKLKINQFQRQYGAWDFAEDSRFISNVMAIVKDLQARVKSLEELLTDAPLKGKKV